MFADALLSAKHSLHKIFFYGEGAAIGLSSRDIKLITEQSNTDWSSISKRGKTQLVLCVSSALKEGVVDKNAASQSASCSPTIASGFETGGIGSLVDAVANSDRLLCFGG